MIVYIFLNQYIQSASIVFLFKNFKILHLFISRERGKEEEKEGEKHQCARETLICCPWHGPTEDLACNPGMRLDQESNL